MLPSLPSKRRHLKNVLMFAVLAAAIGFVGATAVTTATVYADQDDNNGNHGSNNKNGIIDGNVGDGNDPVGCIRFC